MNGEFIDFLAETANEIDEALINNPQLKSSMIKHAEKLMTEAEKYLEYINGEYQKAAKKGYTKHDEQPKGKGWFWYSSYSKNTTYYFPQNGLDGMVTFWMKGEPKPDPLNYLFSMVRDCVGELYKGLEINDYRCFFLACIYDAQRIAAGQERIYFEPQDTKELKNCVCSNVWQKLAGWKYHTVKTLQNLQQTIKTALQAIKANLKQETKNSGDNNTTIPEPNKEKAKKLHEIADALEEWGKYKEKVTNAAEWDTPEAKQIIRKAMTLLVENLALLNECKNKYGCFSSLSQCFMAIEQAASWPKTKDLGDCRAWTSDFTESPLWGGEKRSLADECVRYANEVDRETEQGNKDTKSELEGMIEPKPPVFLQNALWILKHGKKYWWLLILAALVLLFWYILPTLNLFGKKNPDMSLETKTSGDSSPAIITSGPNSPVTVNYDSPESKIKQVPKVQIERNGKSEDQALIENSKNEPSNINEYLEKKVYSFSFFLNHLESISLDSNKLAFIKENIDSMPDTISLKELNAMLGLFSMDNSKLSLVRLLLPRIEANCSEKELERYMKHFSLDSTKNKALALIIKRK